MSTINVVTHKTEKNPLEKSPLIPIVMYLLSVFLCVSAFGLLGWIVSSPISPSRAREAMDFIRTCDECPEICTTFMCVQKAADILDTMDPSKNPCDNLLLYACTDPRLYENKEPDDALNVKSRLFDILMKNETIQKYGVESLVKAKDLFRKCFTDFQSRDSRAFLDSTQLSDLLLWSQRVHGENAPFFSIHRRTIGNQAAFAIQLTRHIAYPPEIQTILQNVSFYEPFTVLSKDTWLTEMHYSEVGNVQKLEQITAVSNWTRFLSELIGVKVTSTTPIIFEDKDIIVKLNAVFSGIPVTVLWDYIRNAMFSRLDRYYGKAPYSQEDTYESCFNLVFDVFTWSLLNSYIYSTTSTFTTKFPTMLSTVEYYYTQYVKSGQLVSPADKQIMLGLIAGWKEQILKLLENPATIDDYYDNIAFNDSESLTTSIGKVVTWVAEKRLVSPIVFGPDDAFELLSNVEYLSDGYPSSLKWSKMGMFLANFFSRSVIDRFFTEKRHLNVSTTSMKLLSLASQGTILHLNSFVNDLRNNPNLVVKRLVLDRLRQKLAFNLVHTHFKSFGKNPKQESVIPGLGTRSASLNEHFIVQTVQNMCLTYEHRDGFPSYWLEIMMNETSGIAETYKLEQCPNWT